MRAVNLIPAEHRKGGAVGARSQGAAFAVLGLLAGVALLVFMYGTAKHQLESRDAEAASLNARAQRVQAEAAQLTPYASFMQMREQRLQEISQLINSRFDWSSAMGELSRVLPRGVALTSLQGTVGSKSGAAASAKPASSSSSTAGSSASPSSAGAAAESVSSATPSGATPTITLQGCALNQVTVAQTLVRLRLVSGVSNVSLQSSSASATSGGGSSGSGSATGSCPSGDPVFTVDVTFQPLPTPPASSTEALESTADAGGSHTGAGAPAGGERRHTVSSISAGGDR
ncbi:MAG TPA: hypothetical protein VNV37_09235 [Solirubrobacteraceae bacterium]|jgi:Tfp pilus assembly protein PilN|nr:hypothetical protein [Solirubrobacteraceae bacterium]